MLLQETRNSTISEDLEELRAQIGCGTYGISHQSELTYLWEMFKPMIGAKRKTLS